MKILFITRGFPSEKDPMSGNYEAVQTKSLARKGHQVSVITVKWVYSRRLLFKDEPVVRRVEDGVRVYEFVKPIKLLFFSSNPKLVMRFRQQMFKRVFKNYVKKEGMPDVVHAHIIGVAASAICLKRDYHLPFVITEHWTKMNVDRVSPILAYQAKSYQYADRVVCVSDALAANLKKLFNIDSLVINNMVSDLFFQSQKFDHSDKEFKFIAVGALRKNKGFDILLDAFKLGDFPDNVRLIIVGGGDEQMLLETLLDKYHLSDKVRLLGVKKPEEIDELLCQSDCFVLSSRLETFGIVVIEALAKGLPVVATICGGPETFVRPEDGILVPKENPKELANAMKYMLEHHAKYDSEEIRQHCYDNFSQDKIADKILEVYQQAIQHNRKDERQNA